MNRQVVGIDIGGANLKYASPDENVALANTFAMWRTPDQLSQAIQRDLNSLGHIDALAVTMTGELADCFADRQVGVQHIVQHVQAAAKKQSIDHVAYYGVDGTFRDAAGAIESIDQIAAANWHALANFVAQTVTQPSLLIDIGSTTTDIIPIDGGQVATSAKTDFDRLQEGSLVYVGCRRTPICGLVDRLRFRNQDCEVMNELFATIDDAQIVLGQTTPAPDDNDSADGKPRTVPWSANRIARMIGLDRRSVSIDDAKQMAKQVVDAASNRIATGIKRQLRSLNHRQSERLLAANVHSTNTQSPNTPCHHADRPSPDLVTSGHGHNLLDPSLLNLSGDPTTISLADRLGADASRSAPAYAVANLLSQRLSTSSLK